MKLLIVAVGQRLPAWAQAACDDYLRRFPSDCKVELRTVRAEPRTSGKTPKALQAAEHERIAAAIESGAGRGARRIALDEHGSAIDTRGLAAWLKGWQQGGCDVALMIGGPDGLDAALLQGAHERLRLSDLTLPHALARVLLLEQLYRAWAINAGHPYHRE
ncbi:MAG: 23S rRNA (pseudouridine(1915)-N(3))-methyltransferase [Burkholderiaceae bacterium]|jgi:23S rRNA (pseudouridine1915-N3)-methyltransferase|nr:MAG: 23S rRNA (pseudouridine(1915)-N(3))-methyltransferase [Burkholderiaceae bacterium]